MPTYEEIMASHGKKGQTRKGAYVDKGQGTPSVHAVIKCPHCDNRFPLVIELRTFNLKLKVPMSKKDLKAMGRGAG